MKKDVIGKRMKDNYENRNRYKLIRRMPVILRLDGKAFHTFTKYCNKPFDLKIQSVMQCTAKKLFEEIQGCKCAYVQSDEISLLLTDFDNLNTEAWFDLNIQKIASVSAAIASVEFSRLWNDVWSGTYRPAYFDSRCFNIPKEDVTNYFIWRQKDWFKNSIQMVAQSLYSHKELQNKNISDLHEMIYQKGKNWLEYPDVCKNGTFIYKDKSFIESRYNTIFTENREIIEQFLV